jgi:hypothetical protein
MSDLNFKNTDNCLDVGIDTPTTNLEYVDYILQNKVKDFTPVKKYTITYALGCIDENSKTIDIPPNYQFSFEFVDCRVGGFGTAGSIYTLRITGIHSSLIQSIQQCVSGFTACTTLSFATSNFYTDVDLLPFVIGGPTVELRITTTAGFVYDITFDIINQTTDTSCDGEIDDTSINVAYTLPVEIQQPLYGATYATTGIVTEAIDNIFEIVADNLGTIGNGVTITGNDVDTIAQLILDYNTANPGNTITLDYIEIPGLPYVPTSLTTFTLDFGVNATIPDNLQISVNTLFNLNILLPNSYEIKICEVNYSDVEFCISNSMFIDCYTEECVDTDLCDSTEDVCNLTNQIMKQHQSLIFGLNCCGEYKDKILKHYIRLVCPDEITCLY